MTHLFEFIAPGAKTPDSKDLHSDKVVQLRSTNLNLGGLRMLLYRTSIETDVIYSKIRGFSRDCVMKD